MVWPTWDSETTMFVYYRTPRITDFFTRAAKGAASGKARKSRMASAM